MPSSNNDFTQKSRQEAMRQLKQASDKLSSTSDPSEQQYWAQQVRNYSEQLSSSRRNRKTAIMIDATLQSPEAFHELVKELQSDSSTSNGLKEVSYRQEGGSSRVRIQATQEAVPQIQQILESVGRSVQQSYSGTSS